MLNSNNDVLCIDFTVVLCHWRCHETVMRSKERSCSGFPLLESVFTGLSLITAIVKALIPAHAMGSFHLGGL